MRNLGRTTKQGKTKRLIVYTREAVLAFLLSAFALGCSLFNNDSKEPVVEDVESPIAAFSVNITSGKAPLTVTFTDSSAEGTSSITQWEWDFGDGNTSTEQNPQHIFETAGSFDVSLRVTSSDGTDTELKNSLVSVDPADVMLKLLVISPSGTSLSDFEASSEDFTLGDLSETEVGYQLAIEPSENEGVIKISKAGYLDQFLFFESIQVNHTRRATLMKRAEPIEFEAFVGGDFKSIDGAGVKIPGQSLVRADGSAASGTAQLYITPVDISDPIALTGFPGSFLGTTDVDEPRDQLFSYGVVDITFEQDGEKLQLKDGVIADVTLPLYASKSYLNQDLQPGDTIPMWYLDEATGLWIYESEGVVTENPVSPNGLSLKATTTHFTAFNGDINPPGLSGGGGGGNSEDFICRLSVNLLGAIEGKRYKYSVVYSRPGWPASGSSREFTYDGSVISQPILRGFLVDILITDGEVDGSSRISCNSGGEIETTITLGDAEPEFISFSFRSIPNFTRDVNGLSEIKTNTIFAGGYFLGAEYVTITSDFLASRLILGNGILFELEHKSTDPTNLEFVGTISNENGSVQETAFAAFSEIEPPILGYGYAYYDENLSLTSIVGWNYEGSDTVRIYELGGDPDAQGVLIFEADMRSENFDVSLPGEVEGFLRFEFENRYGMTPEIYKVSDSDCIPGSDLCVPSLQ